MPQPLKYASPIINNMDTQQVLSFARPCIRALQPYSTARDEFKGGNISVWIDANENPYDNGVNRYPDPHQHRLKAAISQLKSVPKECIFIGGAGSDEAIDLCYRIFCEPRIDNAIAITPSYGVYKVAAAINDVELREVQLEADFSLPVERLLAAADEHSKLIWICSPNNPTANAFPREQILQLADSFHGIVVVDEAYVDFSEKGSLLPSISEHPNIIVLQTFSKAWGMASLRLGMAFAIPEIAALFARVKYPYNVNGPTQAAILQRIEADITAMTQRIVEQRRMLEAELAKIPCIKHVYPSDANFLLVTVDDSDAVYDYLIGGGVIVRNRSRLPGCKGALRITVGTEAENAKTLQLLRRYPAPLGDLEAKPALKGRCAHIERNTAETKIDLWLDLDNNSESSIDTGLKFFDHMLWQIPHHAGVGLRLSCKGDIEVDEHHTMEDVAIALGEAIYAAIGDKRGIERYGFVLPMDESRAMVLIDFGGRADFDWDVTFTREYVGDTPTEMYKHVFHAMCVAMKCNLHIAAKGENNHHIIEGVFKAFARALRMAVRRDPFSSQLPSSKGVL